MKKLLLLIISVLFYQNAKAQAIAGSTVGVYTDIVPDTLLYSTYSASGHTRSYFVDINQDGANDIEIRANIEYTPPPGDPAPNRYTFVTSLNNSFVALYLLKVDSVCNTNILRPFNIGEGITTGPYVTSGYLALWRVAMVGCEINVHDWVGTTDHYIGVRYATGNNVAYGWIRVRVTDYGVVYIRDYALGNIQFVGMNEFVDKNNEFKVYPNPATDVINIETEISIKDLFISIIDMYGRKIKHTKLEKEIDVKDLAKGIYILQLRNNKKEIVHQQKLVKE